MKSLLKKGDIVIIATILAVAALLAVIPFLGGRKSSISAVIVEDGKIVETIDLSKVDEPYEYKINGGVLYVEKNAISYMEADCPDHSCIRMGRLTRSSDIAACVPNKTCVYIEGGDKEEVSIDAITY